MVDITRVEGEIKYITNEEEELDEDGNPRIDHDRLTKKCAKSSTTRAMPTTRRAWWRQRWWCKQW
jgi:hypothetical protein